MNQVSISFFPYMGNVNLTYGKVQRDSNEKIHVCVSIHTKLSQPNQKLVEQMLGVMNNCTKGIYLMISI